MQGKYKIVTLCGSTRFKDDFMRVQKELTLKGYIVISVGLFGHSGDDEVWDDGVKEMLDDMHFSKIAMADEIFVINPNGYIGQSTAREIAYAISCNKKIGSIEPIDLKEYSKMKPVMAMLSNKVYEQVEETAEEVGYSKGEYINSALEEYPKVLNELSKL